MILYKGPFLIINYEKEHKRFVLSWSKSPSTTKEFKDEILHFVRFLKDNTYHQILWLQSNFKLIVDDDCKEWFDKTVHVIKTNKSWLTRDSLGYHHLYFVVGEDIMVHLEVMGIFKVQAQTKIKPRYFATEQEALKCLDGESDGVKKKELPIQINYKGTDKNGQSIIEIKDDSSCIESTIKILKSVLDEKEFIQVNNYKFMALTSREKEILRYIVEGYSNQELSFKLGVSFNTVRTHRNRIWKKLEISSLHEVIKYTVFF